MNELVAIDEPDDVPGTPPGEYALAVSTVGCEGTLLYRSEPNGYVAAIPEPLGPPVEAPLERPEGLADVCGRLKVWGEPAVLPDADGTETPVACGAERYEDNPPVGDSVELGRPAPDGNMPPVLARPDDWL
jgi:hypothetical protein